MLLRLKTERGGYPKEESKGNSRFEARKSADR